MDGESLVGALVDGRYRVSRELGRGSMGRVYEVVHERTGKRMALKTLLPHLADDFVSVARFRREALLADRIGDPHVVDVFDMGQLESRVPYITMELLEGRTLAAALRESGPLSVERALDIAIQICRGLEAAHGAGVVHRDLKPENIFLLDAAEDFVKLLDFGVSKLRERVGDPASEELTAAGAAVGTPYYMAPEQAWGGEVDARADIYALGVVLYEMLTGRRPYEAPTVPCLMLRVMERSTACVTELRPEVPDELAAVVHRALSPHPEDRFQSAEALRAALYERTLAPTLRPPLHTSCAI